MKLLLLCILVIPLCAQWVPTPNPGDPIRIASGGGGSITGGTCTNQAMTAIDTSGVPTCTTITSAYVNSSIAPTASPTFTGTPAAPTAAIGTNTTQLATTAFVQTVAAGINPAVAVLAASTANVAGTYTSVSSGIGDFFTVTATGAFTLDGIAINTVGQRVLLKDQTTGLQNGVYTATVVGATAVSPVFTRALDYDQPSDINSTGVIPVQSGTANASTGWLLTSTVTTVGTDALTYVQFSYAPSSIVQTTRTINTTSPITGGGNLSADRTIACATCATTTNGGALSATAPIAISAGGVISTTLVADIHQYGGTFGTVGGSALSTGGIQYFDMPQACTIIGWEITVDAGTATVTYMKNADGTAKASTNISTSGVAISTGTHVRSTVVTDFGANTAVAANDVGGVTLSAVSGAGYVNAHVLCQ